jgi:hypothetical protein
MSVETFPLAQIHRPSSDSNLQVSPGPASSRLRSVGYAARQSPLPLLLQSSSLLLLLETRLLERRRDARIPLRNLEERLVSIDVRSRRASVGPKILPRVNVSVSATMPSRRSARSNARSSSAFTAESWRPSRSVRKGSPSSRGCTGCCFRPVISTRRPRDSSRSGRSRARIASGSRRGIAMTTIRG